MKKYYIYLETEKGNKLIIRENVCWLHRVINNNDYYATKVKKYGIYTIYKAPIAITKRECEICANNNNPIEVY